MIQKPVDMIYIDNTPFFGRSIDDIQFHKNDIITLTVNCRPYTIQMIQKPENYRLSEEYKTIKSNRVHINGKIYCFRILGSDRTCA